MLTAMIAPDTFVLADAASVALMLICKVWLELEVAPAVATGVMPLTRYVPQLFPGGQDVTSYTVPCPADTQSFRMGSSCSVSAQFFISRIQTWQVDLLIF